MKPLPRPQRKHRFFCRVLNLGFFLLRAITDVFAIKNNQGVPYNISLFFFSPLKIEDKRRKAD